MSNRAGGRADGRTGGLRTLLLALVLAVVPFSRLPAQVGYDPERSPFKDVPSGQAVTAFAGRFFGNRAHAGVGAQGALSFGARFTTALSGALELAITTSVINSQRTVIDPSLPDSTRRSGPIDYRLISADLGLLLDLTGARTWHGLSPYVGVGLGVVAPTASVTDPGGYQANSNITLVPTLGTHARIGRFLSITIEARDYMMRYEWPSKYFFPTDASGNPISPPVLDPATEKDTQMTHNLTLTAGLSFHFSL